MGRLALLVGATLRIGLYLFSEGSNDARTWGYFAHITREVGFSEAYASVAWLNHPIVMPWLASHALAIADYFGIPFYLIFKLLPLLADIGTMLLLSLRWRGSEAGPSQRAWQYALCVPAILISSFHGNTDSLCLFFLVLALYLFQAPHRSITAGIALALAINVKLIPILLVPVMVMHLSKTRERLQFLGVIALGCAPIILASLLIGRPFISNVLLYRPLTVLWGVNFFLSHSEHLSAAYNRIGSYLIIASILLLVALQFSRHVFSVVELATASMCLFLLLAPGFGIQYMIYPAPLLVLSAPRWAAWFNLVAGSMALSCYWSFLVSWWPLSTVHLRDLPVITTWLGLLAWLLLGLWSRD